MAINYPDYHGVGYYNFIVETTQARLDGKIASNNHDFRLEKEVKTRFATVESLLKKYPSKEKLNEGLFS